MSEEPDSGYWRLENQIEWYNTKSAYNQKWFRWLKVIELVSAALIPLVGAVWPGPWGAGALGATIIVLEGLQHLNQHQHNWITYRSTCEQLRHQKFLYLARSDAYAGLDDDEASKLLAERVEELISTEHAKWISGREEAREKLKKQM